MVILLPDRDDGLGAVEEQLAASCDRWLATLKNMDVDQRRRRPLPPSSRTSDYTIGEP
jgi:hypothetical protein